MKRSLKRLVKLGVVVKKGKKMYAAYLEKREGNDDDDDDDDEGSSIDEGTLEAADDDDAANDVPMAQRIREAHKEQQFISPSIPKKKIYLDDEIARLEAELAADSDDEDEDIDEKSSGASNSDSDAPNNNYSKKAISFGKDSIHEYKEAYESKQHTSKSLNDDIVRDDTGIICLSNLANDRIKPLPQSALPQNKRKVLKGIDSAARHDNDDNDDDDGSRRKKKRRKNPNAKGGDSEEEEQQQHTVSEGLKSAVSDLLQNYIRPSTIDRPPFYCRVCQHQSTSQSEFTNHRSTQFHVMAVKEEQKKTYCKLCRKQLTSVVQMEEHLKSRPHRDKMDYVKGKQRGLIGGSRNNNSNNGFRRNDNWGGGRGGRGSWQQQMSNGRGRGGKRNDSTGRQWC